MTSSIRTINVEQFQKAILFSLTLRAPGNRAKVKDLGKLDEYLAELSKPDDDPAGNTIAPAVALPTNYKANGNGSAIKITKRLLLPQQPSPENPDPQDPFEATKQFLRETREKVVGRFGRALPSKIKDGLFVLAKHRPCLCGGKDPACKQCDPEKPGFIDQITELVDGLKVAQAKLQSDYIPLVIADFPEARDRAKNLPVKQGGLGPLYDPNDYSGPNAFAHCFGIEWQLLALGVPEDLPIKLREEAAAQLEKQMTEAADEIKNALRESFAQLIDHATDKLSNAPGEKPKKFHDSLIGNIQSFIEVFQARNLMGDTELESLVNQAKGVLVGLEPDRIRRYASVKEKTREQFESIKAELDKMLITQKGRHFDLSED